MTICVSTLLPYRASNIQHNGFIRYLGPVNRERLLVVGPKALSEVLVTKSYDFHKPKSMRWTIGRLLGIGILLAEDDEHKYQRRHLLPAFSFRHIKDLYPVFWQKSRESVMAIIDNIDKASKSSLNIEKSGERKTVIDAGDWTSRVTLDIIGVSGMGRDFGAIKDPNNHLSQIYRHVFKPSRQGRILGLLGLALPGWLITNLPVKRNSEIMEAGRQIRQICLDMVEEKKERLARKELTDPDILSVALESGAFSESNLVDQVMTFLAAGHETTASAMIWAIYMLCVNPEMQKKLRKEIRDNLPGIDDPNSSVSALEVDKLSYLNAVVHETLRFFPPVAITLREAAIDTTICDVKVPKGTTIILCPWANNRDKALWGPDADKFRPDRWIATGENPEKDKRAGNGGASSNFAFATFLHGPRSCIGMGFARAEFACLLATWVGKLEFELKNKEEMDEKNMVWKNAVTTRPEKGLHVWVRPVEGW